MSPLILPSNTDADDLPPGWHFGVYESGPGWEGRWLVHASGASTLARLRPDITLVRLEHPEEAHPDREIDVSELAEALASFLAAVKP